MGSPNIPSLIHCLLIQLSIRAIPSAESAESVHLFSQDSAATRACLWKLLHLDSGRKMSAMFDDKSDEAQPRTARTTYMSLGILGPKTHIPLTTTNNPHVRRRTIFQVRFSGEAFDQNPLLGG